MTSCSRSVRALEASWLAAFSRVQTGTNPCHPIRSIATSMLYSSTVKSVEAELPSLDTCPLDLYEFVHDPTRCHRMDFKDPSQMIESRHTTAGHLIVHPHP